MPPKKSASKRDRETEKTERETSPERKKSKCDNQKKQSQSADESQPMEKKLSRRSTSGPVITEESILEGTVPFVRATRDADFNEKTTVRILSWNVAGLRAVLKKGTELQQLVLDRNPDILCLQETKISDWDDCKNHGVLPGYSYVDSISVAKKGYSGTRTYIRNGLDAKHTFGFDLGKPEKHDEEGRVLSSTLPSLSLRVINSYVPNAGMTLDRLDYRVDSYDPLMRDFLKKSGSEDGLIWTGDLNVAERDFDRFFATNFKQMQKSPGFTPQERESFRETLRATGMVDAFRYKYPNASKVYSFWSARFNQRATNSGWRLDYFVISAALAARVIDCFMLPGYTASDHCPIELWLKKK